MLIGLHGPKRVGKDTVGEILVEALGYKRASFADPVRDILLVLNPLVSADASELGRDWPIHSVRLADLVARVGWEQAKDNPEVRELLERLGADGIRGVLGDNTLVLHAFSKIPYVKGDYVFTDVRFANEAERITEAGGFVWEITRPGFEPDHSRATETPVPRRYITWTVNNDGSIEALRAKVLERLDRRAA